jgi:hypothetical protein
LSAPSVEQLGHCIFSPPNSRLRKKSSKPIAAPCNRKALKGTVV